MYLDHAASTPMDPRVLAAMRPFFSVAYGNPSSLHAQGLKAHRVVMDARKRIATILNAHEDEIIFCSGGTESDNLAIQGVVFAAPRAPRPAPCLRHVITSSVEHPAVLETLKYLAVQKEIDLTILPVDAMGRVNPKEVAKAITKQTVLVSIMTANNEIGTIQPIAQIGREILKWRKAHETKYPYFHTDACQAAGAMDLDITKSHADLVSFSGSKIYGPKGTGVLVVKRGVKLDPMIRGGGQERGLRSGTENVPGIVGIAKAFELMAHDRDKESKRLTTLRDKLITGLLKIPKSRLNGHPSERLPNNVNISFLDVEGEAAVLYLDAAGIQASTGSACASTSLNPSHVLLALGLSYEAAHGSLRFTLGRNTTAADIAKVIKTVPGIITKLRHMSPVNLEMGYFSN